MAPSDRQEPLTWAMQDQQKTCPHGVDVGWRRAERHSGHCAVAAGSGEWAEEEATMLPSAGCATDAAATAAPPPPLLLACGCCRPLPPSSNNAPTTFPSSSWTTTACSWVAAGSRLLTGPPPPPVKPTSAGVDSAPPTAAEAIPSILDQAPSRDAWSSAMMPSWRRRSSPRARYEVRLQWRGGGSSTAKMVPT